MEALIRERRIRGNLNAANLLQYIDNFRVELSMCDGVKDERRRLGQFFTPIEVTQQMARFVDELPATVTILDPGAGTGILSAGVVSHILSSFSDTVKQIEVVAYEVDSSLGKYLRNTFEICALLCRERGIAFKSTIHFADFILATSSRLHSLRKFDLAILNPPYRKINSASNQSTLLKRHGLPHGNLYAAFMMLATILLRKGGRLVSITPRSFCNGPYFLRFRRALLTQLVITDVHIYHSRTKAFAADAILQENIILGATKRQEKAPVHVLSSEGPADEDIVVQALSAEEVVSQHDRNLVIRLPKDRYERKISKTIGKLKCTLQDLEVSVSTGRVVEFRSRKYLRRPYDDESVPLLLPANVRNGYIEWPASKLRKSGAIAANGENAAALVPNDCYVIVKRFSSKEQSKRLSAAVLDPSRLNCDRIGIENHLNYLHKNGAGLPLELAKGLAVYLNSSIVDQYFRLFSGHTQVNASDLREMKYPDLNTLLKFGTSVGGGFPDQAQLDGIVAKELGMNPDDSPSLRSNKINQALSILAAIGVPRAQQNPRSALTLLALVNLKPGDDWNKASAPLRGITEMMEFFSEYYDVTYKPNTRETVRRQTIHQFWQMGLVIHNPDEPNRPINSPKYCYQIESSFLDLLRCFEDSNWDERLALFRIRAGDSLTMLKQRKRRMNKISVNLPDGTKVQLSEGGQNKLIKRIVEEFCPRFADGGQILYIGDAGQKLSDLEIRRFEKLGIQLDKHGKTPDLIVHVKSKDWLILIEAVTSHGPIDLKRHNELRDLFSTGNTGLVFVTAFATRQAMAKYLKDISWETEVWIADSPDHLIHFDGERFLGPY